MDRNGKMTTLFGLYGPLVFGALTVVNLLDTQTFCCSRGEAKVPELVASDPKVVAEGAGSSHRCGKGVCLGQGNFLRQITAELIPSESTDLASAPASQNRRGWVPEQNTHLTEKAQSPFAITTN